MQSKEHSRKSNLMRLRARAASIAGQFHFLNSSLGQAIYMVHLSLRDEKGGVESRPRQNPPTAQTRPPKPNPWVGLGLSQQARGRVVFWQTQPKTQMGTLYNPKKQKKLIYHFTLNCAVIFDYIMVFLLSI